MRVLEFCDDEWQKYNQACTQLEEGIQYPLDHDYFELDHGKDYYAFFRRLGHLRFFAAITAEDEVAGVIAAIKRPDCSATLANSWYLADLKVALKHQGLHVPRMLFAHMIECLPRDQIKFYGICMNESDGRNRIVPLLKRVSSLPLQEGEQLNMYNLTAQQVTHLSTAIIEHKQEFGFLSLAGKKDLIMQSNQQPLPLLHFQFGPFADFQIMQSQQDHAHLISLAASDPLNRILQQTKIELFGTASTIVYGITEVNWSEILTSDI